MNARKAAALVLLVLAGAALLPLQGVVDREAEAARFRTTTLDIPLREQIGQYGFLAALSGFRSPLAAILWIEAHTAWERTEWGRMAGLFETVTTLQPRSTLYWDMASWHMAWNAAVAAMQDEKQPSEALRLRAAREYQRLGLDFLERGILNNPDDARLRIQLGILLRDKFEDHCAAAEAFLEASRLPGAPSYAARFAGYEMAKCPGREREAYDHLRNLHEMGSDQHMPTLLNLLGEMENKLDIPPSERIESSIPPEADRSP
jgi:hypothetical protein